MKPVDKKKLLDAWKATLPPADPNGDKPIEASLGGAKPTPVINIDTGKPMTPNMMREASLARAAEDLVKAIDEQLARDPSLTVDKFIERAFPAPKGPKQ